MIARYLCKDSSGFGSSSYKHSRPTLRLETSPTFSSTVRCFVIACRETLVPFESEVMECGFLSMSFVTNDNRVGSPRAAKIFACCSVLIAAVLSLVDNKGFDIFKLGFPSTRMHSIRFGTTACSDQIKSGFLDF